MKLKTTLLVAGACAGLLTGQASAQAVVAVDACETAPADPMPPDDAVAEEVTEEPAPEVTEPDTEVKEPEQVTDPAVCGGGVPIDWIRRNESGDLDNPDVIFYTLGAGGPAPVPTAVASEMVADAGKDEALPIPRTKISPVKAVERQSGKTKAVVKSGRVFLRR